MKAPVGGSAAQAIEAMARMSAAQVRRSMAPTLGPPAGKVNGRRPDFCRNLSGHRAYTAIEPGESEVANADSSSRLRFDDFEVDLDSGDVWKHGARMRMQEQPWQVLRLLLERAGQVVTRDELRQKLWPSVVVDFDDGLNTAVRKIRELLDDPAEKPRYIETIPRRGYRFIAPVKALRARKPAASSRPWIGAIAGIVAVSLMAWVGARWLADEPRIHAVAVMPLDNLSGDPSQDYFAAGITDALTTQLARTVGSSLRVTSRGSAEKYRGKPLEEVARALDVEAVVQGSVTRSGNLVRVTARLVDVKRDTHLWAATYERDLREVSSLQGEIAATVARRVHARLDPRAEARLASAATVNPQAYDLFQRARYRAFSNNSQDIADAVDLLEQALRLDPSFAPARAVLARAYTAQAFFSGQERHDLDARALEEIDRALKLDPDLAEAYLARGLAFWTHHNGFPHERAMAQIKRALELDPNLAEAHHWLGTIYIHVGLLEQGRQELQTALRLDPANPGIRYRVASSLLMEGKPMEALPGLEATRAYFPANAAYGIARANFDLGRKAEAASVIEEYLRANSRDEGGVANAMQALIHADAGKGVLAEQSIEEAVRSGKGFGHFHHAAYTIGATYAIMRRPGEAIRWLRAAADDGYPCYPVFERDRTLNNIRGHPDFAELMKDLRARWERYKSTA